VSFIRIFPPVCASWLAGALQGEISTPFSHVYAVNDRVIYRVGHEYIFMSLWLFFTITNGKTKSGAPQDCHHLRVSGRMVNSPSALYMVRVIENSQGLRDILKRFRFVRPRFKYVSV
jgi:hypothetical protein